MKFKLLPLVWIIAAVLSACAHANGSHREYRKDGEQNLQVVSEGAIRKLRLPIRIVDWRIDCSESRVVIWGQARKSASIGAAPHAIVYVVDVNTLKILGSYSTTRGPYDAEFSADKRKIIIDEILVDFRTGKMIEQFNSEDLIFKREECGDFQGRRLLQ